MARKRTTTKKKRPSGPLFSAASPSIPKFDAKAADRQNRRKAQQRRESQLRRAQVKQNTARRNQGGRAPAPAPTAQQGPLLNRSATPVFRGGIAAADRKGAKRAEQKDAQYRRNRAIADYTSKTQVERQRAARAAQQRVEAGRPRPNDQYILDAHYRRTKVQAPKSGRARVEQANRDHDAEVRRRRAMARFEDRPEGRGRPQVTERRSSSFLSRLVGNLPAPLRGVLGAGREGARNADRAASLGLRLGGGALSAAGRGALGRSSAPSVALVPAKAKVAGIVTSPGRSIGAITASGGEYARGLGEGGLRHLPGNMARDAANIVPGAWQFIQDPVGESKREASDMLSRWLDAASEDPAKRGEALRRAREAGREGDTEYFYDASMAGGGASVLGKQAVRLAGAKAPEGSRRRRAYRVMMDERPRLQVGEDYTRRQPLSSGALGTLAQRGVDRARDRMSTRRTAKVLRAEKARRGIAVTKREARQQAREVQALPAGTQGPRPAGRTVVPMTPIARRWQQSRAAARLGGWAQRRSQRLNDQFTRRSEAEFMEMTLPEQMVAVMALEGVFDLKSRAGALRWLRLQERLIRRERAALKRRDPERHKRSVEPVEGRSVFDNLETIRQAIRQLERAPDRVLTDRLRRFVRRRQDEESAMAPVVRDTVSDADAQARRWMTRSIMLRTRQRYDAEVEAVGAVAARVQEAEQRAARGASSSAGLSLEEVRAEAVEQLRREGDVAVEAASRRAQGATAAVERAERQLDRLTREGADEAAVAQAAGRLQRLQRALPRVRRNYLFAVRVRAAMDRVTPEVLEHGPTRALQLASDRMVEATRERARVAGVSVEDTPVFVKHRGATDPSGNAAFSGASLAGGAWPPVYRSRGRRVRLGTRDLTDRALAVGRAEAVQRSTRWRLSQHLVNLFMKDAGRQGFDRSNWHAFMAGSHFMDPGEWVPYVARRTEVDAGADAPRARSRAKDGGTDLVGDMDAPSLEEVLGGEPLSWDEATNYQFRGDDRIYLVPRAVLDEFTPATPLSFLGARPGPVARRFQQLQSAMVLGSNPMFGPRQAVQSAPLAAVSIGGRLVTPSFWRNLRRLGKAYRGRDQMLLEVMDHIGFMPKSAEAMRQANLGRWRPATREVDGGFVRAYGTLFGVRPARLVIAERRAPGAAGRAGQVARSAGRVGDLVLMPTRRLGMAIDKFQDTWFRLAQLAAEDLRLSDRIRRGRTDPPDWLLQIRDRSAPLMEAETYLSALMAAPPAVQRRALGDPDFMAHVHDLGDGVVEFMGDYANLAKGERHALKSVTMFYGFVRHSSRLLLWTLPVRHPLVFTATLAAGGASREDLERALGPFLKKIGMAPSKIPLAIQGLIFLTHGEEIDGTGDVEIYNSQWINPLGGPVFNMVAAPFTGENLARELQGFMAPMTRTGIEAITGVKLFNQAPLSNARGQRSMSNEFSTTDSLRATLAGFLGMSAVYRAANDYFHRERGTLASTSLLFDPVPMPYKKGGDADRRNRKRIAAARREGRGEALLDDLIIFRGTQGNWTLSMLENEAKKHKDGKKKKRKKKEPPMFVTRGGGRDAGFGGVPGAPSSGFGGVPGGR